MRVNGRGLQERFADGGASPVAANVRGGGIGPRVLKTSRDGTSGGGSFQAVRTNVTVFNVLRGEQLGRRSVWHPADLRVSQHKNEVSVYGKLRR